MKVCVIGAGVSGLVVSRHLKSICDVSIMEATDTIGGVWVYNKKTPMYQNLQTNLPKQLMQFKDLSYSEELHDFLTHTNVMDYLREYCQMFGLEKLINYNTRISSVRHRGERGSPDFKWLVESKRGTEEFDLVAVCSGKYDTPSMPIIPGSDIFEGEILHSKLYCTPQHFVGKHVLTVGSKASGKDIAIDLWKNGIRVAMSHRESRTLPGVPSDIEQVTEIEHMEEHSVHFKDGTSLQIDAVILATGYNTNLHFLHPSCGIQTDVLPRPLYKYFINCKYPSMTVFDQCYQIAPFPFSEYQALYYKKYLTQQISLPNEEAMLESANKLLEDKSHLPLKYKYSLSLEQFSYFEELSGFTENLTDLCELYRLVGEEREGNLLHYRDKTYTLGEKGYEERTGQ